MDNMNMSSVNLLFDFIYLRFGEDDVSNTKTPIEIDPKSHLKSLFYLAKESEGAA